MQGKEESPKSVIKYTVVFKGNTNVKDDWQPDSKDEIESKDKELPNWIEPLDLSQTKKLTEVEKCKEMTWPENDDYRKRRIIEGPKKKAHQNKQCVLSDEGN